jgi:hypothetical protein
MMSLHRNERRRTAAVYVLLPAAAVLVASTAWAAASGRLPAVFHTIGETLGVVEPAGPPAPDPAPVVKRAPPEVAKTAPVDEPSAPVAEPSAADTAAAPANVPAEVPVTPPTVVASPKPAVVAHAPASRPGPSPSQAATASSSTINAPPAPAAESRPIARSGSAVHDDTDPLYETAHRIHFVDRDWGAALDAWDRYLAGAPRGRFVPEAKYNRAIALLRLGRRDEAIHDLKPFADGQFSGYRQEEARRLIEATTR